MRNKEENYKWKWSWFLPIFLVLMISCEENESPQLMIATAANMQFTMKEIAKVFTAETGIECSTIISSSGKLTAQIKEGAPYDIFVSANMKYPEDLFENGLTIDPPKIYAYGHIVLWTNEKHVEPTIENLTSEKIQYIAIANPKTAPYGSAAIEVLKHHKLYDQLKNKLVYGESIAQTNQFINSRSANIGFTSKSVVLAPNLKGKGQWLEPNAQIYTPIAQGVVRLKNRAAQQKKAQQFYDFLFSETSQQILTKFGYKIVVN